MGIVLRTFGGQVAGASESKLKPCGDRHDRDWCLEKVRALTMGLCVSMKTDIYGTLVQKGTLTVASRKAEAYLEHGIRVDLCYRSSKYHTIRVTPHARGLQQA